MRELLRQLWYGRSEDEVLALGSPYTASRHNHNTHEHDMKRTIKLLTWACAGFMGLAAGGIYATIYQIKQAKVEYQLVMVDSHYQPVTVLAKQAELMPDTDPMKQGMVGTYLKTFIEKLNMRTRDVELLTTNQNIAGAELSGAAVKKFVVAFKERNPFEVAKREEVIVKRVDPVIPLSNRTWVMNWRQEVSDLGGNLLRDEEWTGQFQLEQDPRRVGPFNIFGLTVVNYALQQLK